MRTPRASLVARLSVFVSLAVIVAATTLPEPEPLELPLGCIVCGELGGLDITLNILLYIPFGLALFVARGRPMLATAAGFGTSLAIELLQMSLIPNRDANIGDLFANTAGSAIGVVIGASWVTLLEPKPVTARRLTTAALLLWIGVHAASSWIHLPAPTSDVWYGQWTPDLRQWERFGGTVVAARLNGVPLISGRLDEFPGGRSEFAAARVAVDAAIIPMVPVGRRRIAPIVSVFDAKQNEILVVGQRRASLVFRMRTNAARLRVRSSMISLHGVFPTRSFASSGRTGQPDIGLMDTTMLRVERMGGTVVLTANFADTTLSTTVKLHSFLGWQALFPREIPLGTQADLFSVVWAALLLFLPGYWLSFSGLTPRSVLVAGVTMSLALVAVPAIGGLAPTPWWGWLGSSAGLFAGAASARVVASSRGRSALS